MSDELQMHLSARDDLSDALERVIDLIRRLERALRDALGTTGGGAERDVSELSRELGKAQSEARELGREIDRTDDTIARLGGTSHKTGGGMDTMGRSGGALAGGLAGMAGKAGVAGAAIAAVGVAAIGAAKGLATTNAAVGLFQQNLLKSKSVFKGQTDEMRKWARAHRADFGGSTQDVMNYATSLQDLIVPMGFGRKQATSMTKDFASLVPVLTAWDKAGRSSAEITDIMSAALTGEREELKSLGVTISQDMVNSQIELMRSQGKLTGATDEQASALATMELLYQKTGDAQKAFANNSDTVARRTQALKADVAQLRDNGLKILLDVWNGVTEAFRDAGFGDGLKAFARWLNRNRDGIVAVILDLLSVFARATGWQLKWYSAIMGWAAGVVAAVGKVLRVMSFLIPGLKGAADTADEWAADMMTAADAANTAGDKASDMADSLHDQAGAARAAQRATNAYRDALKGATASGKEFLNTYRDTSLVTSYSSYRSPTGDTRGAWGVGAPGGLPDMHMPGHTITSGHRSHGLGSGRSDHRHGRALDIIGPRLPDYAAAVRAAGGYAAFHGAGSGRHLHVVPRTAHNVNGGAVHTSTYHVRVEVNNPASGLDVSAEVAAGLRRAERDRDERE